MKWLKKIGGSIIPDFVLIVIGLAAALVVVFLVLIPRAERSAEGAKEAEMVRHANQLRRQIDAEVNRWRGVTAILVAGLESRPRDGVAILQSAMEFQPELVFVRVKSPDSPDELIVQNPASAATVADVPEERWMKSAKDTLTQISWRAGGMADSLNVQIRRPLSVEGKRFWLTAAWNAGSLGLGLDSAARDLHGSVSVGGRGETFWRSDSSAPELVGARRSVCTAPDEWGVSLNVDYPVQAGIAGARAGVEEGALWSGVAVVAGALVTWHATHRRARKKWGKK